MLPQSVSCETDYYEKLTFLLVSQKYLHLTIMY